MKKALLTWLCMAAMMAASMSLKAQEVTITLMPGWTWISVPITEVQDFATTLGSFTPMTGDIIKSQWGNASYTNGQWRGNFSQFYPGYGYMYKSTRTMPVTVTFNVQQPAPQVVVTTSEPTDITINSATCGGNVASSNGDYVSIILRGVCWSTNPNPTFNDNYIEAGNGLGSFTVSMTELTPNTTYYVRAFAVTTTGTFYGNEVSVYTQIWSNGILPGTFSVSENQHVYFSQGNLQFKASANIWRFAENQWDYVGSQTPSYGIAGGTVIGSDNSNISSTYSGWIDLFGWGTSNYDHGANCYQPWSTSENYDDYYAYGNYQYNLFDQTGLADWGYNSINNGGNTTNQWRTLTYEEWSYVFYTRSTTSGVRFAKANINGVNGVILLPDDWVTTFFNLNNVNNGWVSFSINTLTASQWSLMEQEGAVFLPAAGDREGTFVSYVGSYGEYWSATYCNYFKSDAWCIGFFEESLFSSNLASDRCVGKSVRLVRNAE